ncbi:hypothetical protein AV530_004877 [Patagioenas fasciata monilis]|uniref:Uncharacterized protein n=1 Tax=Patagioenas fasciata monilis TaxID=372326 RepID=A0A1V4JTN9_PATFA|nr:hypothetical protein AV530_004877 [Patagioenas fasciata monilis]
MPASSKTDPPLIKAKPNRDGGGTSVITYLKGEKKDLLYNRSQKRGVRICERNGSADTKVKTEQRFPCSPWLDVPLQPMEIHSGAEIYRQSMEDSTSDQTDVPRGDWNPIETHGERRPHWRKFSGRTCDSHAWSSLFLKECTLWMGPMLEQFVKNCSLW